MSSMTPPANSDSPGEPKKVVRRAIGPKLRILFNVIIALLAVMGANSAYLSGVTFLEWWKGQTYQDHFYLQMFLVHIVLGIAIVAPFLVFGIVHMRNTKDRKIRRTVNIGYALFGVCLLVLISGFLLLRVEGVFDLKSPTGRSIVYWAHVGAPIVGGWLYWMHRLVGPKMRWKQGLAWAGFAGLTAVGMIFLQAQDPRSWNVTGPKEGTKYFEPSLARTATGNFIDAKTLDMNDYCLKCHKDAHDDWAKSAHRFSSFNNPAYLASVAETREVSMQRDGHVKGSRFCAGCHDPVPFFSGAFDDPKFDMLNHPTSQSGISCTVCHAITHVNSNEGNADYTIEEPIHYPFAKSDSEFLQWVNNQLVKAKPSFHKKTFLKPLHKTAEFCGACHKVNLPFELNHYKEWLRGQNHYDSWLLSGVSGHGSRSFYYPETAQVDCNGCHMPLEESSDFGAKFFDDSGKLKTHNHLFPSANSGLNWLTHNDDVVKAHEEFLKGTMRVDIFGVRDGGTIDGTLTAPLRPTVPTLKPGNTYLLETVIRTLKLGHHFTQGTTDSNEVWLEVSVKSGDQWIGASGQMKEDNSVDEWSHFVNNFMLDRHGNRIDRRNAQDIFVPLYVHQIPPGAAQNAHYKFKLPETVTAPVSVKVRLLYRKFDSIYMDFVDRKTKELGRPIRGHQEGKPYRNELPIKVLAEDEVIFPVEGVQTEVVNKDRDIPPWQRWNDYGIGMFLKEKKAALRQATEAFAKVEEFGRFDGPLNLARVLLMEGQLDAASEALQRAAAHKDPPAPPWVVARFSGMINRQQGKLEEAEQNFRQVLEFRTEETVRRKFDFSLDYEVINLLGQTIYDRAMKIYDPARKEERNAKLREAVEVFHRTLKIDSENVDAHANLHSLYAALGETELASKHRALHEKYRVDDVARGEAVSKARQKYPAADFAAEPLVIYDLQRTSNLPAASAKAEPQDGSGTTSGVTASAGEE